MIVCVCNAITEKEVREAARKGARTPEAAYATLAASRSAAAASIMRRRSSTKSAASARSLRIVA